MISLLILSINLMSSVTQVGAKIMPAISSIASILFAIANGIILFLGYQKNRLMSKKDKNLSSPSFDEQVKFILIEDDDDEDSEDIIVEQITEIQYSPILLPPNSSPDNEASLLTPEKSLPEEEVPEEVLTTSAKEDNPKIDLNKLSVKELREIAQRKGHKVFHIHGRNKHLKKQEIIDLLS